MPREILMDRLRAPTSDLVDEHHHFIGMHDIEIAAQQFAGKVRIGVAWIEQYDPVPKLVAFAGQLPSLSLSQKKCSFVFRPCEDTAGSRKGKTAQHEQAHQRDTLSDAIAGQLWFDAKLFHETTESQLTMRFKGIPISFSIIRSRLLWSVHKNGTKR